MIFEVKPKMGCIYVAEVLRSDGTVVRRSGESPNILTQYGLDVLNGSNTDSLVNLIVGKGTNVPSLSDTTLTDASTSIGGVQGSTRYDRTGTYHFCESARVYTFNQGAIVGNITEVGLTVGSGANAGKVGSRALFLDVNGNPTAITVLADEILRVTVLARTYESPIVTGVLPVYDGTNTLIDEIPYTSNTYIDPTATSNGGLVFNRTTLGQGVWGSSVEMLGYRERGNVAYTYGSSSEYGTTYPVVEGVRRARMTHNFALNRGNGVWRGFSGYIDGLMSIGSNHVYRIAFLDGKSFTKTSAQLLTVTVDVIASSMD